MKCKNVRELMGAYLYGDLAPHEMKDVRLHAEDCVDCREDLRTRGLVVDAIPSTVPALTDEDRQRLMWSVKGAIRAREREERSVLLRVAPAFGLAAVLALGLGLGALISASHTKPPPKGQHSVASIKPGHSQSTSQTAKSQPKPDTPTESDTTPSAPNTPEVAQERDLGFRPPLALGGISGLSGRRLPDTRRSHILPSDSPLSIAPDSDSITGLSEPSTPWKLPKPVDIEGADANPQPPTK